jgi:hypothetical protein
MEEVRRMTIALDASVVIRPAPAAAIAPHCRSIKTRPATMPVVYRVSC